MTAQRPLRDSNPLDSSGNESSGSRRVCLRLPRSLPDRLWPAPLALQPLLLVPRTTACPPKSPVGIGHFLRTALAAGITVSAPSLSFIAQHAHDVLCSDKPCHCQNSASALEPIHASFRFCDLLTHKAWPSLFCRWRCLCLGTQMCSYQLWHLGTSYYLACSGSLG